MGQLWVTVGYSNRIGGHQTLGVSSGWGLIVLVVKEFTEGRTKETEVYCTHLKGERRTVWEEEKDGEEGGGRGGGGGGGGEGPRLQGRAREYGDVWNVPFFGNLRSCAWL